MDKWEYIELIAKRGDHYGGNNGTYDLLMWCGKKSTVAVTKDEARRFYDNPDAPYDKQNDPPAK